MGYDALLFNGTAAHGFPLGWYNNAVGANALTSNVDGYSNDAFGTHALFFNINGVANTAMGYYTLWNNDSDALGLANGNTAVGATALFNNVDGSDNTAIGDSTGRNVITGFNNTYIGDLVGDLAADESSTIRIGDLSNGNGSGSLQCYIGGIWNNPQPVGGSVVVVTVDLDNDHLGYDAGAARSDSAPAAPHRGAPQPRSRPQLRQAMLNDKVEKLEATVAQQQKQIGQQQKQIETLIVQLREQAETFTAQLKEQATQIQKASALLALEQTRTATVLNQ